MVARSPDVNITIRATDKASGTLKRIGGGFKALGLAVAAAGAAAVVGIAALGFASVKAAISVESAFAGVAKTTDGLIDKMGGLTVVGEEIKQGFRDLAKEVPIAVEELLKIGELAGQLGVPREALVGFTEVIAALGETTNLTTESAAVDIARLANIYQVASEDMVVNSEQTGSALVALGNNFATTESEILDFASRIAGAGKIAGLTVADILAIGTAATSVGIEAAAGGTAVQTVLQEMQKAVIEGGDTLNLFAEATGKTAEEFADAFRTDAAGAFSEFVMDLGASGEQAFIILEGLGLADRRLARTFLSLGTAGDLLNRTMDVSNEAFDENLALAEEARIRYMTTESQLKILKNTFRDIAITIGDAFLPAIGQVVAAARPFIEKFAVAIGNAIDSFLVPAIESVIEFFSVGLPDAIAGLSTFFEPIKIGLGELVGSFLESTPEIKTAWEELKEFFKDTIAPGLQDSFDNIGEGLIGLAELWEENDSLIIQGAEKAFEILLVVLTILLNAITGAFKGAILIMQGDWDGLWQHTKDSAETAMNLILGVVGSDLDEFLSLWGGIGVNLGIILGGIWDATLSGFKFVLDQMLLAFSLWALDIIGEFNDWAQESARAIGKIITKIEELGAALLDFLLPSWLTGSTGDFELSVRGISDAMKELTDLRMPALSSGLTGTGVLAPAMIGGASTSSSFTIEQLTVNAGNERDGRRIAQEVMNEIGRQVRLRSSSGAAFSGR